MKDNLYQFLNSSISNVLKIKNLEYYIKDTNKDYRYVSLLEFNKQFIGYAYDALDLYEPVHNIKVDDCTLTLSSMIQYKLDYTNPTELYRISIYGIMEQYLRESMHFIHKDLDEDTLNKKINLMYSSTESIDINLQKFFTLVLDFILDTNILGVKENGITNYGNNFKAFNLYPILKDSDTQARTTLLKGIPLFFMEESKEGEDTQIIVLDKFIDFKENLFSTCIYSINYIQCIPQIRVGNKLLNVKPKHEYRIYNHIKTLV